MGDPVMMVPLPFPNLSIPILILTPFPPPPSPSSPLHNLSDIDESKPSEYQELVIIISHKYDLRAAYYKSGQAEVRSCYTSDYSKWNIIQAVKALKKIYLEILIRVILHSGIESNVSTGKRN